MGDGVSKLGCYCAQRDEDADNAGMLSAQEIANGERNPYSTLALGGRRLRGLPRGWCDGSSKKKKKRGSPEGPVHPVPRGQSDTVIIFDWDDTLLCSAAINAQQYTESHLKTLERAVESALLQAADLGEVIIVTNGNQTWVEESSQRFLPGLVPVLAKFRVISARARYEQAYPADPFAWKRVAFREILAQRQLEAESLDALGVNLVVVGDSCVEMEAAKSALKLAAVGSLVKTVKLKEAPAAQELIGEVRKVTAELPKIVELDHKLSRYLVPRILPGSLHHLQSWASGWQLSDGRCSQLARVGHRQAMIWH